MLVSNPLSRPFTSMVDAHAAAREASSLSRSRISAHVLFLEFGVCFFKSTTSPYVGSSCRSLEVSAPLFCVGGGWQVSKFKLHIVSMPAQNRVVRVTTQPVLDWWYHSTGVYRYIEDFTVLCYGMEGSSLKNCLGTHVHSMLVFQHLNA